MAMNAQRGLALEHRLALLIAVLLLFGGFEAWQLVRIRHWNGVMAVPAVASASENSPLEVRFARAATLAQRGEFLAALALYRRLADEGSAKSRAAANFNEGNLLVREALMQRVRGEESRSLPLLELAKESYREALREQPGDWDAKYNLELTLRLAPESEDEEMGKTPPPVSVRHSEITTRRMVPGLP